MTRLALHFLSVLACFMLGACSDTTKDRPDSEAPDAHTASIDAARPDDAASGNTSCPGELPGRDMACTTVDECPTGYACISTGRGGRCQIPCANGCSCPAGLFCTDATDGDGGVTGRICS